MNPGSDNPPFRKSRVLMHTVRFFFNNRFHCFFVLMFFGIVSCKTSRNIRSAKPDDGRLEVVFVQVNDVYEIAPLAGGKSGGVARVASLKKQYLRSNPNTLLVIAGDFVSPSVYNSLKYQGTPIRGRQMVECLNAAGMDLATFGNHEFDISETEIQNRINESSFKWISSNSFHLVNGKPVPFEQLHNNVAEKLPETYIARLTDADGTTARIGFIGLNLPFNKPGYVSYTDPLQTAKALYNKIRDSCDAVVAITHQDIEDDIILAKELPGLAVILGGHEHDMRFKKVGNVYITKAHANAKSAYVVKLQVNKGKKAVVPVPELKMLDQSVPLDSATTEVVDKWTAIGNNNYDSLGFVAQQVLIATGDTLDGLETDVRRTSTNLTELIANAMAYACPQADLAIYNAGSIRLDDLLPPPVTQYDIIRSLPFGGGIREADMKGRLLVRILETGRKNRDIGGYLQYQPKARYQQSSNSWTLDNQPIDTGKVYRVALSEFIFTGREANLNFLNPANPDIVKVYEPETAVSSPKSDIRLAVVKYLQNSAHR